MTRILMPIFVALSLTLAVPAAAEDSRKLTFEVRVPADDDPDVFGHIYLCDRCTPETWPSVVAPEGGFKTRDRLRLTEMLLTPREAPEGVAARLDMSAEIPGDEMVYTGSLLSIRPIAFRFSSGIHFRMRVLADDDFRLRGGPRGARAHRPRRREVDPLLRAALQDDPRSGGRGHPRSLIRARFAFAHLKPPYWWTYSSRRLAEDLVISVEGVADVVGSSWGAAWQMITDDEALKSSIPVDEVLNR